MGAQHAGINGGYDDLAFASPELLATKLLQGTLLTASRALVLAHGPPEHLGQDLAHVDHPDRIAVLLSLQIAEMVGLIDQYHRSVDNLWQANQLSLPF